MLVATTPRLDGAAPGQMFTGERGPIAFADISVSIPPGFGPPDRRNPVATRRSDPPVRHDQRRSPDGKNALAIRPSHRARARPSRALVRPRLQHARSRSRLSLAQIIHDSGAPALPVLFTWPRAASCSLSHDREERQLFAQCAPRPAAIAGEGQECRRSNGPRAFHGQWALEALHQMSVRNGRIAPKIANIVLAAPDVDSMCSSATSRASVRIIRRSQCLSRATTRLSLFPASVGGIRAGAIDPKPALQVGARKAKINAVDLTDVKSPDRSTIRNSRIARDREADRHRLAAGQTLNDGRASMGEKIGVLTMGRDNRRRGGGRRAVGAALPSSIPIRARRSATAPSTFRQHVFKSAADVVPGR